MIRQGQCGWRERERERGVRTSEHVAGAREPADDFFHSPCISKMSSDSLSKAFGAELVVDGGDHQLMMEKEVDEEEMSGHSDTEKEKMTRKFSANSVVESTDDEEDDGGEEGGEKPAVPLGPQVPLKDHLELDKDDESLRRWKEQLLGSVDLTNVGDVADPEVKIERLTIVSQGRPDLELGIPLVADAKGFAFCLKDGSKYRLKFSFTVSNNIVSGLRYHNTVWKTGVRVENTKVMLGTFSPQKEPYTYELEEETTPSGFFARGSYSAKTKFVDDDGKCYLDISYSFEIRKEWPSKT